MSKLRFLLLTCALLLFVGCNSNVFYSHSEPVSERGWSVDQQLLYSMNIVDTIQFYNFYVDLRITDDYPYSNFFFFINTRHPDGATSRDTLECSLANPDGSWLGRSTGRFVSSRYFLRKNVRFPQQGVYRFSVEHGMRDSVVVGIHDVGLHVEKVGQ